ncbi:MAG: hypothetical protein H6699_03830 [Myxococcales bacterium]|nr:hypothetical protein [Myxococcales bacterium]
MSSSTLSRSLAAILVAAAALVAGCGDARLSTSGEPAFDDTGRRPNRDPDAGVDDTSFIQDDVYRPPDEELGCVLIPSVGGDVYVGVESAVQIGAYQYSLETGEAMPDERITFAIVDDVSVAARLSSENVRTNEDGLAAVRLSAGATSGTVVVRVFSPCANSIDIEVDVLELPTGNLRVGFNYPFRELYDVAPVETYIYPADELRCRDVARGELPSLPAILEGSARDVTDTTLYEGLQVDQEYTVVGIGRGNFGERAATGCADAVFVRDSRTTDLTIDLFLIPLDPVGDYDVLSHWDFRDAIADSGEVGAMIVEILDIFDDPGRGIVNFILGLVEDYVGGIISVAVDFFLDITGLDDVIGDAINDLIDSSPFLSDIVTIGRDLRAIIAELEVISDLSIGKLGSDYEVFGVDEWRGLALYWRLGCEPSDPPDCGRLPIVLDSLDLGLLRGDWTGRVIGYDRLDIDRHPVDFEYGRLILYVLEMVVLPAITGDPGPVTLEDLMAAIINCDGIGDFVAGGDGDCRCALGACICDEDVENICEDFIGLTFGTLFRGFVEALSFDAVLDIRGSCSLVNNDDALDVDELRDGDYIGNIYVGSSPTPFVADFCGVNKSSRIPVTDVCLE